jgi:hypothetical protein
MTGIVIPFRPANRQEEFLGSFRELGRQLDAEWMEQAEPPTATAAVLAFQWPAFVPPPGLPPKSPEMPHKPPANCPPRRKSGSKPPAQKPPKARPRLVTDPQTILMLRAYRALPPAAQPLFVDMVRATAERWPAQKTRRVVLQFRRALGDPYPDRAAQAFMRAAILPVNDRGDAPRA